MIGSENIPPNQETTTWKKDSSHETQKQNQNVRTPIVTEGEQLIQHKPIEIAGVIDQEIVITENVGLPIQAENIETFPTEVRPQETRENVKTAPLARENVEDDLGQKKRQYEIEKEAERDIDKERERDRGHEVIEIIGERYLQSQEQSCTGLEHRGILIRSSTINSSTNINHVLCGPHALEICCSPEFTNALSNESICQVKISKRSEHNEIKFIPKGYTLCWEFILQSHDIRFSLKQKLKGEDNKIIQQAIIDRQTYEAGEKIQGKCECENDTSVILVWDNSYSKFTSKNINFRMTLVNMNPQKVI